MNRRMLCVGSFALAVMGCGTDLVVSRVPMPDPGPVPGIVVNRRATYEMTVEADALGFKSEPKVVSLVDPHSVLVYNIKRYPFSSGKLSLTLDKNQSPKVVAITSQSGAARSLDAARAPIEAKISTEPKK